MSGIAQAASNTGEQCLGNAGESRRVLFPSLYRDDRDDEKARARNRGAAGAYPCCNRPRQRGTYGAGQVERDCAESNGTRQVLARYEIVDTRLLRRQVESEGGADEKGQRQKRQRTD